MLHLFLQANEILETAVYGSRQKGEIGKWFSADYDWLDKLFGVLTHVL